MSDAEPRSDPRMMYRHLRAALARAAIQAYLLLNGAAAAAVLAFIGNLSTRPAADTRLVADLGLLKLALLAFAAGVSFAATTYLVAFMVHSQHIGGNHARAERTRRFGVAVSVLALLLFVAGVVICSRAITPR